MVALVSQATKKATHLLIHQMQMKSLFFFLPCLFPLPRFGLFFCVCVMLVFFKAKQSQKEEKQIELFFPLFFLSSRRLVEIAEGCLNDAVPKKEGIHIFTFFFAPGNSFFEPQLHHRTAS